MKKYLAGVVLASNLFLQVPSALAEDAFDCGEWSDVRDEHLEILTEICEYGLMQGHDENNYGYGDTMLRAELAVVVNRLLLGDDVYADLGINHEGYADYLANLMSSSFTDIPSTSDYSNEWIIKAMYYSSIELDIITGDGDSYPTTYRPLDSVNIVEAFKILYQSAYEGDLLSDDVPTNIQYTWDPWWEELMNHMEDTGVILHLDTDYQSFWLGEPLTVSYTDFSSAIDREDAAIFLYYMIERDLISQSKLEEQLNSECSGDVPCSDGGGL